MNNKLQYKLLILVCCCLGMMQACRSNHIEKFNAVIHKTVASSVDLSKLEYIVIIPNEGCGGCITYAEEFYKRNRDREDIHFVFTRIMSRKILKQKVSINPENTYLDEANIFLEAYPVDRNIYPCILRLREGSVTEIHYQSPQEDGFAMLTETNTLSDNGF
ncbi:hypothetical protein [uncultured Rikenella sp.]|uniref:hypothetical protein n=1 Tax=uncultured Rikenella sp. TaxID=368003 RepID=UPI00261B6CC5|nr:hypothetical protein [uncultured Rikenella sp.]